MIKSARIRQHRDGNWSVRCRLDDGSSAEWRRLAGLERALRCLEDADAMGSGSSGEVAALRSRLSELDDGDARADIKLERRDGRLDLLEPSRPRQEPKRRRSARPDPTQPRLFPDERKPAPPEERVG